MSIFQSFQTGLALGQEQRKQREVEAARKQAADLYRIGNVEGATTGLMAAGLYDESDAYARAGERAKAEKRRKDYGAAFETGGWTALGKAAAGEGDFEMAGYAQGQSRARTLEEWEDRDRKITEQKQGMEFLARSAANLRSVAPEFRGEEAMKAIAQSPFAKDPAVMQAVQQAAADGRITDEELTRFEEQMLTYAERLEAERWQKSHDLNAELGRGNLSLGWAELRQRQNERAAAQAAAQAAAPDREIRNDPNGVPRFVDTGEPVFPGVEKATENKPLIGSEAMARVATSLANAKQAVADLRSLVHGELGDKPTGWFGLQTGAPGYDPASDWGAAVIEAIPDWGALKGVARWTGGEDYRLFKDAYASFEAAMLPIISGAAITPSEGQRLMKALQIKPGDTPADRERKLATMQSMVRGAELAAKGDIEGFRRTLESIDMSGSAKPEKVEKVDFTKTSDDELFYILRGD